MKCSLCGRKSLGNWCLLCRKSWHALLNTNPSQMTVAMWAARRARSSGRRGGKKS